MQKKLISVVVPTYNEEDNVEDMYKAVKEIFLKLPQYDYENIFIDNGSTDKTVMILRRLAVSDRNLKIIVNIKNFGHIRSPYYGILQAGGDCVILMAADFQDPPQMIPSFLKKWEDGHKIVIGVKDKSEENRIMFFIRSIFYKIIGSISETEYINNFTGFGLYDRSFISILAELHDPYPYFRGLVAQLGADRVELTFTQPKRKAGKTKNNFYTLYDMALNGFVNHSKVPIRLASLGGFVIGAMSFVAAVIYFIIKIVYWDEFSAGIAPLVISLFFFSSVQLFFIGIIGEYIGAIYTKTSNHPLVVEKERINFDKADSLSKEIVTEKVC